MFNVLAMATVPGAVTAVRVIAVSALPILLTFVALSALAAVFLSGLRDLLTRTELSPRSLMPAPPGL